MDKEMQIQRIPTSMDIAPRFPNWEVKETGYGFERRTIMTEQEFNVWRTRYLTLQG